RSNDWTPGNRHSVQMPKNLRKNAVAVIAVWVAAACSAFAANDALPVAQQNALVHKYCAVCHTDRARNGGLSLEHYDAAETNAPLAAMLLSQLPKGAMGAAGLGIPDKAAGEAWVAATAEQAARAGEWSVIPAADSLSASIVREVAPRKGVNGAPVYRLTLSCDGASRRGEMQL